MIPVPPHGKDRFDPDEEPTAEALAAIEREWSLIQAEIELIDAEIRVLTATGGPSEADWQRLRRAVRRVLREAAELATREARTARELNPPTDRDSGTVRRDAA
jgi:hypothetical protein